MKLIILQTVTPDYRSPFFSYLKNRFKENFILFGGEYYFQTSIRSDQGIKFRTPVKNLYFFGRRFLFQTGMWASALSKNIVVLELNPRIVSNWLILYIRFFSKRKTILWGHAWPRGGVNSKSDMLRNLMRSLADEVIVYTLSQAKELKQKMPKKEVKAAPNAVFLKGEMKVGDNKSLIKNIIYVGRLAKDKKVLLLVKAFGMAIGRIPEESNLIVVGDGEDNAVIKDYIKENKLENRIKLLGHISDAEKLKQLYNNALMSVSPGYIGLSVTQSFSFGVPMIVSKDENHSPEIEAVIEGENAVFFTTDNTKSLEEKIVKAYEEKESWIGKREKICDFCKKNYSIESMAENFIKTLTKYE